jgi:hypothetical protein
MTRYVVKKKQRGTNPLEAPRAYIGTGQLRSVL